MSCRNEIMRRSFGTTAACTPVTSFVLDEPTQPAMDHVPDPHIGLLSYLGV
jgi:hypothetical protein